MLNCYQRWVIWLWVPTNWQNSIKDRSEKKKVTTWNTSLIWSPCNVNTVKQHTFQWANLCGNLTDHDLSCLTLCNYQGRMCYSHRAIEASLKHTHLQVYSCFNFWVEFISELKIDSANLHMIMCVYCDSFKPHYLKYTWSTGTALVTVFT